MVPQGKRRLVQGLAYRKNLPVEKDMNGTCQTCGTVAPIEWFLSETEHRQLCGVLVDLPKEIQPVVFHYLSLFRPVAGRAMQTKKATRLLTEIKQLVAAGHVEIDHKVARPCPPRIWVQAIEKMVEQRFRLTLPMPNHNYLKSIAWDMADQADSQAERNKGPVSRTANNNRVPTAISNPLDQYVQGLRDTKPTDEEMEEWKVNRMK